MASLLLPIIYLAFISLGLPDALLGAAWPTMYPQLGAQVSWAGGVSMTDDILWLLHVTYHCRRSRGGRRGGGSPAVRSAGRHRR